MVRLFFALECPGLKTESLPRTYISEKARNYHITIAFLGERPNPEFEVQRVAGKPLEGHGFKVFTCALL